MAWLFGDTFDNYTVANINRKWTSNVQNASFSFTSAAGRHSSNGLRMPTNGGSAVSKLNKTLGAASGATFIFGAGFTTSNLSGLTLGSPESQTALLACTDNGTTQVWFRLNSTGTITAFNGSGTTLGTTSANISAGVTSHIGCKVVIHPTTGSVVFYINGVGETILASGVTRVSANSTWNEFYIASRLASGGTFNFDWDDVYVCDGSGSFNNDFLGDVRGDSQLATSDGANTGWTPNSGSNHYDRINESTPDDDTTYNSTSTVSAKDTFNFPNAPVSGADIYAVQLCHLTRKTDAGTAGLKGVVRISGTDYLTSEKALTSTYSYIMTTFEQDPATSTPWTTTSYNAAEKGYQKSS